jgi:hypothetical protein
VLEGEHRLTDALGVPDLCFDQYVTSKGHDGSPPSHLNGEAIIARPIGVSIAALDTRWRRGYVG